MSVSDKALEMGDAAEQIAQARAFIYEQAIVYQVRANVLFSRQELARAMSTISRGVRFCGRHGQFKSLGRFYFLASAIYYSGGDYRRCLTYLQKSTQVAERLGDEFLACGNVIRFAMIHHGLGEYGNALRYLDRAENMLENTGRDEEVVLVSLARLDICLDLGMDEADRLVAELRGVGDEIRLNRRGYYHFLLGRRYEAAGDNALARTNYDVARELFIRGDIADDTFMATAALARLSCRMGDEDSCDAHLAYLEKEAPNVESDNVRALFGLAKLEHATRHVRDDRSLYVVAESSEVDRRTITEVYTQLIIDAVLFRAWRRLGEREKSLEAFRRFHASVKKVLANLSDRSLASCFLAQPAISEPLREFKEFQGEK
jgi:tetratricopeptide (TPR) repeat protein